MARQWWIAVAVFAIMLAVVGCDNDSGDKFEDFTGGSSADDDDSSPDDDAADDDTGDDDDVSADDDDAVGDDDSSDDDDSTGGDDDCSSVTEPFNHQVSLTLPVVYHNADPFVLSFRREILTPGGTLTLDGSPLPLQLIHETELAPGDHTVAYNCGAHSESTTFTIFDAADLVDFSDSPEQSGTVELPSVTGTGVVHEYTFTNNGTADISDFRFFSTPYDFLYSYNDWVTELTGTTTAENDRERALLMFDLMVRKAMDFAPARFNDWRNELLPDFFLFSHGFCVDQATEMAMLLWLSGMNSEDLRFSVLSDHTVLEVRYDNAWHVFDPYNADFWTNNQGEIADAAYLSNHPEAVLRTGDSNGENIMGYELGIIADSLATYTGESTPFSPTLLIDGGPGGGFTLVPGESLSVRPFGSGPKLVVCPDEYNGDCEVPHAMGTLIFDRTLTDAALDEIQTWTAPTPFNGLVLYAEPEQAGSLWIELRLNGSAKRTEFVIGDEPAELHLETLFEQEEYEDLIRTVTLEILPDSSARLASLRCRMFSQMSPKALPEIGPDQRKLSLSWNGGTLDTDIRYEDYVDDYDTALFFNGDSEVAGNGESVYRLQFTLFRGEWAGQNSVIAAGHTVAIRQINGSDVEIVTPAEQFRNFPCRFEPVCHNMTGPYRYPQLMPSSFYLRGDLVGQREFEFLVDGVPVSFIPVVDGAAQANRRSTFTVDFLSPEQ